MLSKLKRTVKDDGAIIGWEKLGKNHVWRILKEETPISKWKQNLSFLCVKQRGMLFPSVSSEETNYWYHFGVLGAWSSEYGGILPVCVFKDWLTYSKRSVVIGVKLKVTSVSFFPFF